MNASEPNKQGKYVRIYRLIVFIIAWTAVIIRIYIGISDISGGAEPASYLGNTFSYFTIQSNIMVVIWITLALLLGHKEERSILLHPIIHGAICLYITVTFLIFAIFLSGGWQPTGIEAVSNLLMHYIIPFIFIGEWIISETTTPYKYKYLIFYTFYPFGYLFYTVIRGYITGFYPYYFFDLNSISVVDLIINVILLIILFTILGGIYITINRKLYKSRIS